MSDHHQRLTAEAGQAADNRRIISKATVSVQLGELGAQTLNVVKRVGPVSVARELYPLPGRQRTVDLGLLLPALLFQVEQLCLFCLRAHRQASETVETFIDLCERLFKVQIGGRHGFLCRGQKTAPPQR